MIKIIEKIELAEQKRSILELLTKLSALKKTKLNELCLYQLYLVTLSRKEFMDDHEMLEAFGNELNLRNDASIVF